MGPSSRNSATNIDIGVKNQNHTSHVNVKSHMFQKTFQCHIIMLLIEMLRGQKVMVAAIYSWCKSVIVISVVLSLVSYASLTCVCQQWLYCACTA